MERTSKVYHATKNFMFKYFLAFTWIGFNFVVFCKAFTNYHHDPEYYYLSKILGNGLCISRGTAPVLNLTMTLIALPVARTFNVLLNTLFGRWSIRALVLYLEKIKVLHITLGAGLIIVSVIHSIAHIINIINFVDNYDDKFADINWASGRNDSKLRLLVATPTGFSGCVMLVSLFAIAYCSRRPLRDRCYNSFRAAHHLFLVFYGMMFYHPLSDIIKYQTNLRTHPNGCDTIDERIFRNDSVLQAICSEQPKFSVAEKRFPTAIHNTVSLSIAVRGDWTQQLYDLVSIKERLKQNCAGVDALGKLHFLVDGPYPSAMTGMLKCKRIVYIGAGVGITPFAGLIRHHLNVNTVRPSRMHLIWIVQKVEMFTWFAIELSKLQERFWKQNKPDRFTLKLYLTRNYNNNIIDEYFDEHPTLKARINRGRPKWDDIFADLASLYPRKSVNVFSCGPKGMTKELKTVCSKYRKNSCKFTHISEGFG
ncbi:NADPH oxidase 4-like isoform X2 [Armigeres subalbatus]|uniref:NADPH oxidase 4-like isoform X2 n=1 Tax=Armigeres subalbatus TaxID=124917 RepID=UPI002ED0327E